MLFIYIDIKSIIKKIIATQNETKLFELSTSDMGLLDFQRQQQCNIKSIPQNVDNTATKSNIMKLE